MYEARAVFEPTTPNMIFTEPPSLSKFRLKLCDVNFSRWHQYIQEQIWNRTSTKAVLRKRLDHRWKSTRPLVRCGSRTLQSVTLGLDAVLVNYSTI